jgi:rfaE bifunctional protein nucleotidyltransferase chain/domain
MSLRHQAEITPQATQIWDSFQKETIPYLLGLLPDELFESGREPELFLRLNKVLYEKFVADGAPIPRDIQYRMQLDVCSLMPIFKKLTNKDELMQMVFDAAKPGPSLVTLAMPMSSHIIPLADAPAFRAELRKQRRKVVATNGCFDLLHVGHLRYLTEARALGDFLWIGLNGDASVGQLKGPGRPLVAEADRAELLAAWRVVDAVTIFPDVRATDFLKVVRPDIYVKGGDYTVASLDQEEAAALKACSAKIEIVKLVPGKSTTRLVEKMAANKATGSVPS